MAVLPKEQKNMNPLSVEASKVRKYPGGEIVIEQELGKAQGIDRKIVSYPSDGHKVYALMTTPLSAPPEGGYPVILLNHGYIPPAEYRTDGDYESFVRALTLAGYRVFKSDYRGHGSSEGSAEGGNFSPVYAYDVLNLLASVKRAPGINAEKIGMVGHSMGGGITLRSVVASSDIKASVIVAGVVGDTEDMIYRWNNDKIATPDPTGSFAELRKKALALLGGQSQQSHLWRDVAPVNFVSSITGPMQIHHGASDTVVPITFSERLAGNMAAAGKDFEYYPYEETDHNMSGPHRELFFSRMILFLDQNVKNSN